MLVRRALIALCAMTLLPAAALAQQLGPASRFMQQRNEEVNRILHRAANDDAARRQRSEQITHMLSDLLDYDELSRRALGDHWGEHNEGDRHQFITLLRQLVERNYENNLERIVDFEVRYTGEAQQGDLVVVHTEARSRAQRRQPPVAIDYTVRQVGQAWKVVDVTTDGVSLVSNYRTQFHRIISRDGWAELIHRMQHRLEQGGTEG